jgi:hypothetical protein
VTALGGVIVCNLIGIALGRAARTQPALRTLSLGAYEIVRSPRVATEHALIRVLDMTVLTIRFLVAAAIIDFSVGIEQAALVASTFFILSIITPAGSLGPREMGVAALGFVQGEGAAQQLALAALVVSLSEILSAAALGALGAARIKPLQLLHAHPPPEAAKPES